MSNYEQLVNDPRVMDFDRPVLLRGLNIGGINNQEMIKLVKGLGVKIDGFTRYFLESLDFKTLDNKQTQNMIKVRLNNIGLKGDALSYPKIRKHAKICGFKECPKETPFELFLNEIETISNEPIFVATQPVYNSDKIPFIFRVDFVDKSVVLTNSSTMGGTGWVENDEFLFMLPKEMVREVVA